MLDGQTVYSSRVGTCCRVQGLQAFGCGCFGDSQMSWEEVWPREAAQVLQVDCVLVR